MADNYELEAINVEGKTVRLTDKQLTDRFNAEVTNRINADTSLDNKINTNTNDIYTHINNKLNPHNITKAQIGLGNVDNISKSDILLSAYPVGSIYKSTTNTSPAELFGGTWEQIKDRFLLAAGDTYMAGSTGGEATHTLTTDEIPSHSHEYINGVNYNNGKGNISAASSNGYWDGNQHDWTQSTGGGQAHNNMPPYLAVYAWKRVA